MRIFWSALLSLFLFSAGVGVKPQPAVQKFSPDCFAEERQGLVLEKELNVAYGKIYQFRQQYRGMDVLGGSCTVCVNKGGEVVGVNDRTKKISSLAPEKYSLKSAEERALSYGGEIVGREKVVYGEVPQTCYRFTTTAEGGMQVIVSASGGQTLLSAPLSLLATTPIEQTDVWGNKIELPIEREQAEDGSYDYYLADEVRNIYCYDAQGLLEGDVPLYQNKTGVFDDAMAVTVYSTIVKAYDFYTDAKNIGTVWRGIAGNDDDIEENWEENGEIPLTVLVHYGYQYENANCGLDGTGTAVMYVGDGNQYGTLYRQGRAADVIAHEYQHAITEIATPEGLLYLNESGAINESISDIFGALVEGYELTDERFWTTGEEAGPVTKAKGLRSIMQPEGINIMHMSEERPLCTKQHNHYDGTCDNGNAHGNATLLPHAQYHMWQKMPDYFTRERIGTLWFSTLGTLSFECTFREFAEQMTAAAKALGFSEEAQDAIYESFFECGILGEKDVKTHLVTFRSDKEILEKITVRDGTDADFPVLPDRVVGAGTYVFRGWDHDLTNVTQDIVTQPVFELVLNKYTVKFMSEGREIARVEVEHGKSAPPPTVPQKAGNERCDYEFEKWDTSFDNVTGDLVVNAVFKEVLHKFDVTFCAEGREIAKFEVEYGGAATPPEEVPAKQSTEQYEYQFAGWDQDFENITSDLVVNAQFKEETRKYSVKFMDGEKLASGGVWKYGSVVKLEPLEEEGKTFDGWYFDQALTQRAESVTVSGDVTLYAKWKNSPNVGLIVGVSVGGITVVLICVGIIFFRRKKSS